MNEIDKKQKGIPGSVVIAVIVAGALTSAAVLQIWYGRSVQPTAASIESFDKVPDFNLTDQDGKPFGLKDLKGKVWAASFVYTTCKSTCPMLTATMSRLQSAMPSSDLFRMISVTVDPKKDTPAVLKTYAINVKADLSRWSFLTGSARDIKALATYGFKLGADPGVKTGGDDDYDIMHSNRIVLVDQHGVIRGYFDAMVRTEAQRLKRTAQALLADGR